jgi:hypothetical protein
MTEAHILQELEELRLRVAKLEEERLSLFGNDVEWNSFGSETWSHISLDDVNECFKCEFGIAKLIRLLHFSPNAPLNRNIQYKNKYTYLCNGKWRIIAEDKLVKLMFSSFLKGLLTNFDIEKNIKNDLQEFVKALYLTSKTCENLDYKKEHYFLHYHDNPENERSIYMKKVRDLLQRPMFYGLEDATLLMLRRYSIIHKDTGWLYIVWTPRYYTRNKEIYKIGRTVCLQKRLIGYPKGTKLLYTEPVWFYKKAEAALINSLLEDKNVKKAEQGREYFEASLDIIRTHLTKTAQQFTPLYE